MIKRYRSFLFLLVIILIGCEKDDICIEGSENTSRITLGFVDYKSKGPKDISLESIRGIGIDSIIEGINGNYLKFPLMVNSNITKYVFEYIDQWVKKETGNRVSLYSVECRENEKNSAIFIRPEASSTQK